MCGANRLMNRYLGADFCALPLDRLAINVVQVSEEDSASIHGMRWCRDTESPRGVEGRTCSRHYDRKYTVYSKEMLYFFLKKIHRAPC